MGGLPQVRRAAELFADEGASVLLRTAEPEDLHKNFAGLGSSAADIRGAADAGLQGHAGMKFSMMRRAAAQPAYRAPPDGRRSLAMLADPELNLDRMTLASSQDAASNSRVSADESTMMESAAAAQSPPDTVHRQLLSAVGQVRGRREQNSEVRMIGMNMDSFLGLAYTGQDWDRDRAAAMQTALRTAQSWHGERSRLALARGAPAPEMPHVPIFHYQSDAVAGTSSLEPLEYITPEDLARRPPGR